MWRPGLLARPVRLESAYYQRRLTQKIFNSWA